MRARVVAFVVVGWGVLTAGESGPLLVGLTRYLASVVGVMEGGEKRLEIPSACM